MCKRSVMGIAFVLPVCLAPAARANPSPSRNRIVRLVTVSRDMLQADEWISDTLAGPDHAAAFHPDVACLPGLSTHQAPAAVQRPNTEGLGNRAAAALPMGKRLFETDLHSSKLHQRRQKYGQRVEVVGYHDDNWCTLSSVDPELMTEDVMAEVALTPLPDYRARAMRVIDGARAGGVR